MTKLEKKIDFILSNFQVEDEPADKALTKGQKEIFTELVTRRNPRLHIQTATQYGKSLVIALAAVWISCIQEEIVAVIAPTGEKAKIIMRYYIDHLGDSILFYSQLEAQTRLERLRKEESKERIILTNGGGIYALSTNERNLGKSMESAMGQGARILIQDESGLIRDTTEATIYRMIAGKGKNTMYCKLGNPFYRDEPYSHFYKSSISKNYKQIFIDYIQGIEEGRYQEDFIEDAKTKPLFDVLFECKFPDVSLMDDKGFRKLLEKEKTIVDKLKEEKEFWKDGILGVDIGGGSDLSTAVLRKDNRTKVVGKLRSKEIMDNIPWLEKIVTEWGLTWSNVNIDDTGIGNGVSSRCREKGYTVNAVVVGSAARDNEKFMNLKAEISWAMRLWCEEAHEFEEYTLGYYSVWSQLNWYKFKVNSEKRIQMQSKQDLKKEHGGKSPDFGDAFMLTFYEPAFIGFV